MFPVFEIFSAPGVRLTWAVIARLSGGLALLVKKWSDNIERINVEYDSMTLLKLSKHLLGTGKHVVLLGVYLPPSSSNYCHETDIQNGVAMLEQYILGVDESFSDLLC